MAMDINYKDKVGYVPDLEMIGTFWKHFKKEDLYVIYGFVFDAEQDIWKYVYKRKYEDQTEYTRSPQNFHEHVSETVTRFTRYKHEDI